MISSQKTRTQKFSDHDSRQRQNLAMQLSCTKFTEFMYQIAVCIGRKTSYLSNAEDPINLYHLVSACQPVLVNLFTAAN